MKISVMIVAKNEEKMIAGCIKSVNFSDEVVVIDDYSTDLTAKISKSLGARVYKRKLDGFATQKNFGIKKCKNKWVLILDADERVDIKLKNSIKSLGIRADNVAYKMSRKNYIKGKWVRYGGLYPDYQVRLINKNKCSYGQREVHEMLEINGKQSVLEGDIIHYTYDSYKEYYNKVCKYAKLESKWIKKKPNFLSPYKTFIKKYFIEKGYKDGVTGIVSALYLAKYQIIIRTEMKK